jgi:hypothetical protein
LAVTRFTSDSNEAGDRRYDWNTDQWVVPANLGYSKVFSAGGQLMSWQVGGKPISSRPTAA